MARILVVDDDEGVRTFLAEALEADGHVVRQAAGGAEGLRLLDAEGFHVLVTDLRMPRVDGMTLVRKAAAEQPELEVIVVTAHGTVETAVEAMKLGRLRLPPRSPLSSPRSCGSWWRARSSAGRCATGGATRPAARTGAVAHRRGAPAMQQVV